MPFLPGSGQITWLGSIVLVCAVFLLGCGGGSDAPPADSGASADPAADEAAYEAAMEGETPEGEAADEAAEGPGEESAAMEEPAGEEKSGASEAAAETAPEEPAPAMIAEPTEVVNPRPEDVVTWQDEDYLSAKEDRDPRLLDAVAYLGENSSGDPEAAKLLVELLATPEDPEPEPKPEPKVEKKPAKKAGSEYDEYPGSGGSGGGMEAGYEEMYGGEEMEEGYEGTEDDLMTEYEGMEGYEEMYGSEGSGEGGYPGSGGSKKAATKTPLAASYVSLTGGIVRALGANGTNEARKVLEQLLGGKVSAGKERAAVGAVLRTLIDYPSTENDELLRKALTAPESFRPSSEKMSAMLKQALGQMGAEPKEGEKEQDVDALVAASLANTVTAEDIQDTTLPLVEKSASMGLRYDLAAYLIGKPSEKIGPRLQELVTATHPLNIQAQIGLYRYAKTPPEMRDSFERYFTSYASSTLGRMLAVSTDEGADLEEPVSAGPEGSTQGAKQGWSGFGDKPTQQGPQQGSPSGGSMPYGSGSGSSSGSPEGYGPGSPEDMETGGMPGEEPGSGYPGETEAEGGPPEGMAAYEGYGEGSGGPVGPGGEGGARNLQQGPGKADKMSLLKFEEVAAGNPNLPYELARQLWGKELGGAMVSKMNALTGLEEGAQLLMLAGHIPTDAMRTQLQKTLQAHWVEGPQAFASASVASETGISDPGFIPIIKSLPRREPPARANANPTKEQIAQYAWMETAYGTVLVFCERFQTAADNEMVNQTEVLENLPFRPHSTDTLTHVYAVDWQKRVGNRLTGAPVDPMRIYYLRFEETSAYNKVTGAYKRAVPKGAERLVKNGLWIDGGKTTPEGRKVSMDVIIDRTDFRPDRKAGEAEPMVIQVLYVEINDPNPPKAAAAG